MSSFPVELESVWPLLGGNKVHGDAESLSQERGWQDQANCLGVDPDLFFPVGTTGQALAWVGDRQTLLITSVPGEPTGVFAGEGNRAEIYVNPDPLPYVELETLGHLRTLRVGESTACTNFYRLDDARADEAPKAAARRLLDSAR